MQTPTNKTNIYDVKKHSLLAGAFLILVILGAKIDLDLGGRISFTLQTLFLGLAYFYLPLYFRLGLIVTYLTLGIVGVPVFNGGVGWEYFSSWPLGFFVGFVLAAIVPVPSDSRVAILITYFLAIHVVIVLLGLCWYSESVDLALNTLKELSAGVLIKSLFGALVITLLSRRNRL
ncbi:MAG: biotin transporter BioY [Bacteroidia bacterium]